MGPVPMWCPVMCQAMAKVPSPLWPFWPLFHLRPMCHLLIRWALALALTLARRLGPGTQPCHPEQPCRHLHLQTKTPLFRFGTSTTIPTVAKTEPPCSSLSPVRLGAKLFGDCYSQCFSLYSTNALYLHSLPLFFSASLSLSLLFLASLVSFGKEVGGNNDWKTSFRPHAGSAGEEERGTGTVSSNNICVIRSARR